MSLTCRELEAERDRLREELADALSGMVCQGCAEKDGVYDSMAISTYADAIRRLIDLGVMEQVGKSVGRRVFARFV